MGTRGRATTYAAAATVVAVLGALLAGCDGGRGTDTDVLGTWTLVHATTPAGPLDLLDGGLVHLTFAPNGLGGRTPCNDYGSDYDLDGSDLDLADVSRTLVGCDGAAGELESGYLSALGDVDSARREADTLVLTGEDIELRFDAVPAWEPTAVVAHTWLLHSWADTSGAAPRRPTWRPGQRPFIRLDQNGRRGGPISASTGCRPFTGHWRDSPSGPLVTKFTSRGYCPEAFMEQEIAVGAALSEFYLETREREGRTELVLTEAHGDTDGVRTVLVFRR